MIHLLVFGAPPTSTYQDCYSPGGGGGLSVVKRGVSIDRAYIYRVRKDIMKVYIYIYRVGGINT